MVSTLSPQQLACVKRLSADPLLSRRHALPRTSVGAPRLPYFRSRPLSAKPSLCRATAASSDDEAVYFDGGPHFGDLILNLCLGITGVWMPLTLAAIFRCLFLRYRFTNQRFTLVSGLSEDERRDFDYSVVTDVKCAPRFIGEWGDVVLTLKDKTLVEFKSIPCYRQVAAFCEQRAAAAAAARPKAAAAEASPKGFE